MKLEQALTSATTQRLAIALGLLLGYVPAAVLITVSTPLAFIFLLSKMSYCLLWVAGLCGMLALTWLFITLCDTSVKVGPLTTVGLWIGGGAAIAPFVLYAREGSHAIVLLPFGGIGVLCILVAMHWMALSRRRFSIGRGFLFETVH